MFVKVGGRRSGEGIAEAMCANVACWRSVEEIEEVMFAKTPLSEGDIGRMIC